MESVFTFFIMLLLFGMIAAIMFKYRNQFRKWVKDPNYGATWRPKRETTLRRKIEDAEAELVDLVGTDDADAEMDCSQEKDSPE